MFSLHELILCVSEDHLSVYIYYHSVGNEMFVLNELIVYVFEDIFSV